MSKITTNSLALDWPQDLYGITQQLKREGCRAIGRMGGDSNNYELVMSVLKTLAAHAKAKLAEQEASKLVSNEQAAISRQEAENWNTQRVGQMERQITAQMTRLTKSLSALTARSAK